MTQPLMVAYGIGVDSTAALAGLYQRGQRPDAILAADVGSEKKETYAYIPIIQEWLQKVGFPPITIVRYVPSDFKHWPPYGSLGENCLTNGTLPSLAFGFKSCSLKWKVQPQNKWTEGWQPAIDCWEAGQKVRKIIGYDAGGKDMRRYAHAKGMEDPRYDYWYPLVEWGAERETCKEMIRSVGLPVPPKSACIFCPATQPAELHEHRKEYLRYIIIMEARAEPRLEGCMTQEALEADFLRRLGIWERKHQALLNKKNAKPEELEKMEQRRPKLKKAGEGCAGLWRQRTKKKPAMMTDYIRDHSLLPFDEIEELRSRAPKEIIDNQQRFANGEEFLDWHEFLEMFSPEDAVNEIPGGCAGCQMVG